MNRRVEENGRIVSEGVREPKKNLQELIDGITAENGHEETDFGAAVGREIW